MVKLRLLLAGIVIFATVGLNLFLAPRWDPVWFRDAAFTPVDQFTKERSFRIWDEFLGVQLAHGLGITHVDCVPRGSAFHTALIEHQELTGLTLTSRCEPIDLRHRNADDIHPDMVTTVLVGDFLYATDPSVSVGDSQAILANTRGGTLVLIPRSEAIAHGLMTDIEVNR